MFISNNMFINIYNRCHKYKITRLRDEERLLKTFLSGKEVECVARGL